MIDEQRFHARQTALREAVYTMTAANMLSGGDDEELSAVLHAADRYEDWLMRPDADQQDFIERWRAVKDRPVTVLPPEPRNGPLPEPPRAECGAFLRPDWYTDEAERQWPWNTCSGAHEAGWHLGFGKPNDRSHFATHHALMPVVGISAKCACGSLEWPCPRRYEGLDKQ